MTIDSPISGPPLGQIASYDQLPPISNRPGTMADQVQAVLLEAILDGTLPPGTHLKAEGLTRRYGISIIPVREALRTLQAGGWVDIRPHHGAFVRSLGAEELEEINEFRGIVEVAAARLAAQRRSAVALAELEALCDEGFALIESDEFGRFAELNSRFHDAVAAAAGNQVMRESQRILNQRIRLYTSSLDTQRIIASTHEHAAIVAAIGDQDAAAAGALAAKHLNLSLRRVRGIQG